MEDQPTAQTGSRRVLGVLVVFALLMALCDGVEVFRLGDTFLTPLPPGGRDWSELRDWSAAQCYEANWRTALLAWAGRYLPDAVMIVAVVLFAHGLLWSGIYFFGRAVWQGSPWVALLGVALVRVAPDLFHVHLLSGREPSRLIAVGLAFWSSGFLIRRRWVAACCAAALEAHFSPTVACWFAQFIFVALFCLNYEWGWRKSMIGVGAFLVIAAGPMVRFLVEVIVPDAPIPGDAMMGLHFLAEPTLSPFSVPLWSYLCLVVYLAMSFVWLKRHYSRQTIPVLSIFFLIGTAGLMLQVLFVGLIPVERAARFELHTMLAFWFLWIAVFYAPEVADEIRRSWQKGTAWRPVFYALAFSMPVVWTAATLLDRWRRPPRWSRVVVVLALLLLVLTAFVLPGGDRPVAGQIHALAIAAAVLIVAALTALARQTREAANLARAMAGALAVFVALFLVLDGAAATRAFSETRGVLSRDADWAAACRWIAKTLPDDSVWSVAWRPRQFRRWTGRAVLVNHEEIPQDPSRRFEWFERYVQTHGWPGGDKAQQAQERGSTALVDYLRDYRRWAASGRMSFRRSLDWLVVSPALPMTYGVRYALCDRIQPPRLTQADGSVLLDRTDFLASEAHFLIYKVRLKQEESPR